MGKMLEEHDWRNYQERAQEGCMPFCYCLKSYVSKMVSNSKSKTIGEEADWIAIRG